MKAYLIAVLPAAILAVGISGASVRGQNAPKTAEAHVAAAKAAAGQEHTSVFNSLCAAPAPAPAQPPQGRQGAAPQPQGPPPRAQWHAEPAKVFDNLYFLGQTEYTAFIIIGH